MNLIESIQNSFYSYLLKTFSLEDQIARQCTPILNIDAHKQQFGDLNSSAAMILAKELKRSPREIAEQIVAEFSHDAIEQITIAGPGFLNLSLTLHSVQVLAQQIFEQKQNFFKPTNLVQKRFNIEFVSANPTGPLHLGHGRGGIIGDVLTNVLRFIGHTVTKEYYINDAGRQIQRLGESLKIRYQQIAGMNVEIPEDGYMGEYLIEIAKELTASHGPRLLNQPDSFFADYAKNKLLEIIRKTLAAYGITFDEWFSEKNLHDSGAITRAIEELNVNGYLYTKDDALWFKSTDFGDDKDRVVRKASGELTYAAADIAYIQKKADQGYTNSIILLGHDHHSYAVRLQGIRQALKISMPLDVILYQLVNIKEDGKQAKLSKRAGRIVSLSDIIETVGKDVARFFYLNRKADAQLEFDIDLALSKTDENPVYYIQYAFVRMGSIIEKSETVPALTNITAADAMHIGKEEQLLVKKVVFLKELLENVSTHYQTYILAHYALELAQLFSTYYAKNRVVDATNIATSRGRILTVNILRNTLSTCFELLSISQPDRM